MTNPVTVVDSREYLAEERTLLAWLRTALALAAFGFVLDRFSIFIRVPPVSTGCGSCSSAWWSTCWPSVGIW